LCTGFFSLLAIIKGLLCFIFYHRRPKYLTIYRKTFTHSNTGFPPWLHKNSVAAIKTATLKKSNFLGSPQIIGYFNQLKMRFVNSVEAVLFSTGWVVTFTVSFESQCIVFLYPIPPIGGNRTYIAVSNMTHL